MEEQKKDYQEKAHQKLDEIFKEIDSLEVKLREKGKGFSQEMEKRISELKVEGEKLKGKIKEMADANSDSWDEIRNGFEQASNSLRDSFSKAWKNFQGKEQKSDNSDL